jgi:DNA mismatch repair ATPase MutS
MRYIPRRSQHLQFPLTNTQVKIHEVQLRRNARVIDELDVTLGFASLASDMHFTRPTMTDKLRYFFGGISRPL